MIGQQQVSVAVYTKISLRTFRLTNICCAKITFEEMTQSGTNRKKKVFPPLKVQKDRWETECCMSMIEEQIVFWNFIWKVSNFAFTAHELQRFSVLRSGEGQGHRTQPEKALNWWRSCSLSEENCNFSVPDCPKIKKRWSFGSAGLIGVHQRWRFFL